MRLSNELLNLIGAGDNNFPVTTTRATLIPTREMKLCGVVALQHCDYLFRGRPLYYTSRPLQAMTMIKRSKSSFPFGLKLHLLGFPPRSTAIAHNVCGMQYFGMKNCHWMTSIHTNRSRKCVTFLFFRRAFTNIPVTQVKYCRVRYMIVE